MLRLIAVAISALAIWRITFSNMPFMARTLIAFGIAIVVNRMVW
jgi:hypothetical protein